MRRLLPVVLALVLLPSARAEAVTLRDIVDLTRAGMSEEVLLALIEVDGGVFSIDTATLTMLKREGVSERVIVAMVRSGRNRPPLEEPWPPPVEVAEAPAPAPPVVVIDHREVPVPVAVPIYVPVFQSHGRSIDRRIDAHLVDRDGLGRRREHVKPVEPVYWGFGGKLRPDAWQPAPWGVPAQSQRDRR